MNFKCSLCGRLFDTVEARNHHLCEYPSITRNRRWAVSVARTPIIEHLRREICCRGRYATLRWCVREDIPLPYAVAAVMK